MAITFIIAVLTALADIVTKIFVANNFEFYSSKAVIPGVLNFTNISNDGIAFGWLDNARWLFMLVTALLLAAGILFAVRCKGYHPMIYGCVGLILGGGFGNFLDRIIAFGRFDEQQAVVDFIDFCAFPEIWRYTFNVADIAVCIGAFLFVAYLIILDRKAFDKGYEAILYEKKKNGGNDADE